MDENYITKRDENKQKVTIGSSLQGRIPHSRHTDKSFASTLNPKLSLHSNVEEASPVTGINDRNSSEIASSQSFIRNRRSNSITNNQNASLYNDNANVDKSSSKNLTNNETNLSERFSRKPIQEARREKLEKPGEKILDKKSETDNIQSTTQGGFQSTTRKGDVLSRTGNQVAKANHQDGFQSTNRKDDVLNRSGNQFARTNHQDGLQLTNRKDDVLNRSGNKLAKANHQDEFQSTMRKDDVLNRSGNQFAKANHQDEFQSIARKDDVLNRSGNQFAKINEISKDIHESSTKKDLSHEKTQADFFRKDLHSNKNTNDQTNNLDQLGQKSPFPSTRNSPIFGSHNESYKTSNTVKGNKTQNLNDDYKDKGSSATYNLSDNLTKKNDRDINFNKMDVHVNEKVNQNETLNNLERFSTQNHATKSSLENRRKGNVIRQDNVDKTDLFSLKNVQGNEKHKTEHDVDDIFRTNSFQENQSFLSGKSETKEKQCDMLSTPQSPSRLNENNKIRSSSARKTPTKKFTNISNIQQSKSSILNPEKIDAVSLRDHLYHDWLSKKNSKQKLQLNQQKMETKNKNEDEEMTAKEKKIIAQKAYEAWDHKKAATLKSKKTQQKKVQGDEKQKIEDKLQRRVESAKYFDSWKKQKDEELKKVGIKKRKEEKEKTKKEFNDKVDRSNDAQKTFDNWKMRKEDLIKDKKKELKLKKESIKESELEKLDRKQQASREYENWKEKRVKSARPHSSTSLTQRPWCPSSRNSANTPNSKIR